MKQLTFNDSFIAFLHRKNKNWVICHNAAFNQMCLDISNKLNPNVDIGVDTMELLNLFISKRRESLLYTCLCFVFPSYQWSEDKSSGQAYQCSQIRLSSTQWCLESGQPRLNGGAGSVRSVTAQWYVMLQLSLGWLVKESAGKKVTLVLFGWATTVCKKGC